MVEVTKLASQNTYEGRSWIVNGNYRGRPRVSRRRLCCRGRRLKRSRLLCYSRRIGGGTGRLGRASHGGCVSATEERLVVGIVSISGILSP